MFFRKKYTTLPSEENVLENEQQLLFNSPVMKSESPEPYTVYITTSMMQNNTLPDEIMQPLGIRWFEFSTDKGFILNGKAYKLISTNRHQCYNRTGNVLPDKKHIRDVMLLKHIGDTRC